MKKGRETKLKDFAYLKDNKRVGSILGNDKNFMKTSVVTSWLS